MMLAFNSYPQPFLAISLVLIVLSIAEFVVCMNNGLGTWSVFVGPIFAILTLAFHLTLLLLQRPKPVLRVATHPTIWCAFVLALGWLASFIMIALVTWYLAENAPLKLGYAEFALCLASDIGMWWYFAAAVVVRKKLGGLGMAWTEIANSSEVEV